MISLLTPTIDITRNKKMNKNKRPLNKFVHCSCGATYISGYTHCPKCGKRNETIDKKTTNGTP